jgi:hypothetical protein
LDLTLGNLIPSHEACALPSIFIQIALMDKTLGVQCEYTGRLEERALRTRSGERIDQGILFSPRTIDMEELEARRAGPVSLYGLNMQTGTALRSNGRAPVRIEENGFYIFRITASDGTESYTWLYKSDPDFVNTSDYDPLLTNPMRESTWLDLSLLEESVREVSVFDLQGNEHLRLPVEQGAESVELMRQPSMADGSYLVEVRTAGNIYPLKLEVGGPEDTHSLEIFPGPVTNMLHAHLSDCPDGNVNVAVSDLSGKILFAGVAPLTDCTVEWDASGLVPGMYLIRFQGAGKSVSRPFVKAPY